MYSSKNSVISSWLKPKERNRSGVCVVSILGFASGAGSPVAPSSSSVCDTIGVILFLFFFSSTILVRFVSFLNCDSEMASSIWACERPESLRIFALSSDETVWGGCWAGASVPPTLCLSSTSEIVMSNFLTPSSANSGISPNPALAGISLREVTPKALACSFSKNICPTASLDLFCPINLVAK